MQCLLSCIRREDGEECCEGERRRPFLEQKDESVLLDYGLRICWHGIVVTYLGSLAEGEAFSGPSLKVDDFW
jgi:hypothetical protein